MKQKLFSLLAKTDHLAQVYKNSIGDYIKFFKSNQSAFKGLRKTYTAEPGTVDDPSKRGFQALVTTVGEKMNYFTENSKDYLNALFSLEKTNSSGVAKANLIVEGEDWGEYTSLELMRLKNIIDMQDFKVMLESLPVRPDNKIWEKTLSPEFNGRDVFESELLKGENVTTEKESYIVQDPNIAKIDGLKYTPILADKSTKKVLGNYTYQEYSGEVTHIYRANTLRRLSVLKTAVIVALKEANDCEVVQSDLNADKIFNYLFKH